MNQQLQITFRDMEPSKAVERLINEKAEKLEKFYDRIISCRVVVEAPHRRHTKGNLYHVSIVLALPGDELIVDRDNSKNDAHEDVFVAVRDAFEAMTRDVQSWVEKRREQKRRAAGN